MTGDIKRVTLLSPAGHQVQAAEDQVQTFLDAGWTKATRGSRRADTGSIPTQTPSDK